MPKSAANDPASNDATDADATDANSSDANADDATDAVVPDANVQLGAAIDRNRRAKPLRRDTGPGTVDSSATETTAAAIK